MTVETLGRSRRDQQLTEEVVEKVAEAVKPLFFELKPELIGTDVHKFYASKFGPSINDIWFGTLMQFKEPLRLHTIALPESTPLIVFPASDMVIDNVNATRILTISSKFQIRRGDKPVLLLQLPLFTDLLAFVLKPEVRKAIEEGSVVFENSTISELIESLIKYADELAEQRVHRYVKPADIFEPSSPREHIVFFGVPVDSELHSTFKIVDYVRREHNVNWVMLRSDGKNTAVSLKHDNILGTSPMPKLPDKLLEYIEEVLNAHSNAIAKLAEEAKATATRYVLAHLAIVSYAKLEI